MKKILSLIVFVSGLVSLFTPQAAEALPWTASTTTNNMPAGLVRRGDFMGNGGQQTLVIDSSNNWWVGKPTSTGVVWSIWLYDVPPTTWVLVGDFDGTENDDVLLIDNVAQTYRVVYSNQGQGFLSPVTWLTGWGGGNDTLVGDFSGTGRDDVLVMFQSGTWYVMKNNLGSMIPSATFTPEVWLTGWGCGNYDLVGNFTGRGLDDVCVGVHNGANETDFYVLASTGTSFVYSWSKTGPYANNAFAADIAGYGACDVFVMNQANASWYEYTSTGAGFSQSTAAVGYGGVTCGQFADYNGDGKDDFAYSYGNHVGLALSNATGLMTISENTLPAGANVTGLYPAYINQDDDAEDVMATTSSGSYNCIATSVSPTRVETMRRFIGCRLNSQSSPYLWQPAWHGWPNPVTNKTLYVTGITQQLWNPLYTNWFCVDLCTFLMNLSTRQVHICSGSEIDGQSLVVAANSTFTQPPRVPFAQGGMALEPGWEIGGGSTNYFFEPVSYVGGTYFCTVEFSKSPVGGNTPVTPMRFPYWDGSYQLTTWDATKGWYGSESLNSINVETQQQVYNPQLNSSGHTWYVDKASFFVAWPYGGGGTTYKVYLYLNLYDSNKNLISHTALNGGQPISTWNQNGSYTSPTDITFSPALQVPNGQYFFLQSETTNGTQNMALDVAVYSQVRK